MIDCRLTALLSAASIFAVLLIPTAQAQVSPAGDRPSLAGLPGGFTQQPHSDPLPPVMGGNSAICRAPRVTAAASGSSRVADALQPRGTYGLGHDQLHYWYQTLKQPGTGMSCCNNQDCRPTTYRLHGSEIQVEVDGEWTTVPPNKILNVQPPDLNAHVCAPKQPGLYPKGYVFCVVLGSGV
jgi:hypothetical protein